jgi:hypothetical protein
MNTNQIRCVIGNDRTLNDMCIGAFPFDELQHNLNKYVFLPKCYILNVFPANIKINTHWVAVYHVSDQLIEFQDSMGQDLDFYNLSWLYDKNIVINHNKIQFQSNTALTCAHHALLYLMCRSRNISNQHYTSNIMSLNKKFNDIYVRNFIERNYSGCLNIKQFMKIKI